MRKRILKSLRKIFGRGKKQSGSEQTAQNYEILFVFEDILYIKEIVKSGSPTKTFEIHEGARLLCLSRSKPLRDRTYAIDISRCETAIRLRECNRHEFFLDCLLNTLPTTTDEIRVSELRPDIGDSRFPATLWKLNEKVAVPALDVRVALPHQLGSLELIHEAAPMNLGHPILICVIRNEAQLLDKFIDHYRALGIKNFIFIDNESTDDSVATCQRKSNNDIAIFSTSEIYREARSGIDWTNAVLEFLEGHGSPWLIVVDADEFIAFPGDELTNIENFCHTLNQNNSEAVFTPLLDLYSKSHISELVNEELSSVRFFDSKGYKVRSAANFPFVQMSGGPRSRVIDGADFSLKKIGLFKLVRGVRLKVGTHALSKRLELDPATAVLLHYKFSPSWIDKVKREAIEGRRTQTQHYKQYQKLLDSSFSFFDPEYSIELENSADITQAGLMITNNRSDEANGITDASEDFLNLIPMLSAASMNPGDKS